MKKGRLCSIYYNHVLSIQEEMNLGLIKEYKVLRETNIGYTLIHNEMDYFLHKNETNFRKLKEGENVKAFLYLDKQKRPALTLAIPNITVEQPGFATVVNSVKNLGGFVYEKKDFFFYILCYCWVILNAIFDS